ncbi:rhomboid family protein [Angomonas deanei]|uniref:Transmembrane protein 115 n=1 Tax=Angomonas deanei TaxID=59799 RepID=A0A7G2CDS8_9TRYP|nr:rhomboid family protein [Angomonas deanei]CAD2217649.1 hypothetical protein, conserved [Angomonas deanei]|eukprot:EPY21563.1 rhomboid family protein [Angomonas deanei]
MNALKKAPVCCGCIVLLIVCSLVALSGGVRVRFPFSYILCTFWEKNVLLGALWTAVIVKYGALLEAELGSKGVAAGMAGVSLITILLYRLVTFGRGRIFTGMWAVVEYILVFSCRQPEYATAAVGNGIPLKVSQLPFAIILLAVAASLILGRPGCTFVSCCSMWLSWYYLRYTSGDVGIGALHTFFYPSPIRNAIFRLGSTVFRLVFRNSGPPANAAGSLPVPAGLKSNGTVTLPGSTEEEATRRRNIALQALEKRLQQVSAEDTGAV